MDQINLKDIIKLILKRKWTILVFTACCAIISAVVSIYLVTPSYSHRIIFSITPVDLKSGLETQDTIIAGGELPGNNETYNKQTNRMLGAILNKMSYPRYDADSVAAMIGSAEFEDKIYGGKSDGSVSTSVSANKDLNQITIVSMSQFPDELTNVAKAVKEYLPGYISDKAAKSVEKSTGFIKDGLQTENENIKKYKKEMDEFLSKTGGKIESLSSEDAIKYREIENNYVLAAQAYDSYKIIEKELSLIKTGSIESMLNIQMVYEDSAPVKISPRIKVNIILAIAAGFMFVLFFLIVFEFWQKKQS